MKTKDFALEIKDLSNEGTFEGYGSVFGNRDSYGDKVMPGAFVGSLARHKREGSKVLMLWQHNPDEPIGVWDDLAEDAKGLWGKGRFLLEVQRAREAHALAKAGAIQGLSIGYREVKADNEGPDRLLKELDLYEISPVSFPANRRARIEAVKSDPARWWALHDRLREFDTNSQGNAAEIKKEIEDMLQIEECPKSLRPFLAKRLLDGRSESDRMPIRSESEGKANDAAAKFLKGLL